MSGREPFVLWSEAHQAILWGLAAGALALLAARRRLRAWHDVGLRRALAVVAVGNELSTWVFSVLDGEFTLPLQLCEWAVFVMGWALWRPAPRVCEVAYFWALAGSLQAVLTPDLAIGFPDRRVIQFFVSHGTVVLGAVYLAVTGRVPVTFRSIWRVWLLTNGYAAIAGLANWTWGTNYGYLARKPLQPSLLDHLGPWPWYILAMEAVALASFFVYYAPLALARRWTPERAP
jgi:hypothetical integral membrane protein (TIGR02206 family)